jgi:pSer/pThr/pTyr-binding forkhead associated (FHA) protein
MEHAPEPLPQIESTPIPELVAHLQSSSSPQFGTVPETDPILFSQRDAGVDSLNQAEPAPTPQPVPHTIPTPGPEPVPTPKPEPDISQPIPEPDMPQPAPDVPQPLPEPNVPQTPPQAEHAHLENLSPYQELLPQTQPEQTTAIPRLIINSPYTEQPYEIRLESVEITLGRAGSSDILLDQDNLTSRHHALLKHENDAYLIYDRRSANGVFVNGQKIEIEVGYELADGDHISIGNYELIFRLSPIMSMA